MITRFAIKDRPFIPLLLSFALFFWIGAAASLAQFADGMHELDFIIYAILFVFCFIIVAYCASKCKYALCIFAIALLIGVSLSLVYMLHLEAKRALLSFSEIDTVEITVLEDARIEERGISYKADIKDEKENVYRARVYEETPLLRYTGDVLEAKASLSKPSDSALAYYNSNGLVGNVSVKSILNEKDALLEPISEFRRYLISCFKEKLGEEQLLLSALILGERSELSESTLYQEVKVTGLAHMIAVSGAHLVVIQGFLLIVLKCLKVSLRINVAVQIIFLCAYMAFVGMPIPCLRATLMASLSLCALLFKRKSSAFSALGAAIVVFVIQDPSCSVSISFALSALATFGIMLFMPLLTNWYHVCFYFIPRFVFEPLALTLCSLITTIPLTTSSFSQFSLISPLANILVTPLFSFLCIVGVVACLLAWLTPLFSVIFSFMCAVAHLLCELIGLLASLPFACIPVSVDFIFSFVVSSF